MNSKSIFLILSTILCLSTGLFAQKKVVIYAIQEEIAPSATRINTKALNIARTEKADLIIIDMDTYGGLVTDADSIRKAILNIDIPVVVFINPNAASAGALISIACDRIYMRPGSSIGAATVVTQDGSAAPDKYQSYMRSIMRSTAKAHGQDTFIVKGDTVLKWKRDPMIAEAMVDPDVYVKGVIDSVKVLTFTPDEAHQNGFCDHIVNSIEEILKLEGLEGADIVRVEKSGMDIFIGFITHPGVTGVLVLLILGGLYYELQTPGVGFPLIVSIIGALLYFGPFYIEGLARNWEILIFLLGFALIAVEVFALPGFGIAGISGILCVLAGLILSMIDNQGFDFTIQYPSQIGQAFVTVTIAITILIVLVFTTGTSLDNLPFFKKIALSADLKESNADNTSKIISDLEGQTAIVHADLKPQGKIMYEGKILNAHSFKDYILKGQRVVILRKVNNIWLVDKIEGV